MGKSSGIEWTDHTFNPWWGCAKVSPACKHCYAESFAKRTGHGVWGVGAPRRVFGPKHWAEPLTWARDAEQEGRRHRVFCASMADVFEDREDLVLPRDRLWKLIRDTAQALDWQLLTKRPENILRMAPPDVLERAWVGTTVEDADHLWRIEHLVGVPARVRFLSMEPLLGPVDLGPALERWRVVYDQRDRRLDHPAIDWVIVGGESGGGARPFNLAWARTLRDQCWAHGVAFFCKQLGAVPVTAEAEWRTGLDQGRLLRAANRLRAPADTVPLAMSDAKGGELEAFPEDLQVRQLPAVRYTP